MSNWGLSYQWDTGSGLYQKDYWHASKTFRSDSYQNSPKFKYLFHTYFEINSEAIKETQNFGLLVKEVKLPSFSLGKYDMNQYNRKRIVYTKISYEPVDITFHDDNGDTINYLWESYYRYYFNDSTKIGQVAGNNGTSSTNSYNYRNIYASSNSGDNEWGFLGGQTQEDGYKAPFFKRITVFGFNQHNFTAYSLINPMITSFSHDSYNYGEVTGTMQNRMSLQYEAVAYDYGQMDGRDPSEIVTGFGLEEHYDTELSPITGVGSNGMVLGKGSLVSTSGGSVNNSTRNNPVVNDGTSVTMTGPLEAISGSTGNTLSQGYTEALNSVPYYRNMPFSFPALY